MKAKPEDLKREVEEIREGMTPVLDELDHRRHEMTDWKLQLQRRGPALLKGIAALAGVIAAVKFVTRGRARAARKRRIARLMP